VHLPVILSPDGGKLSKRKGAASVGDYRDLGYLPETMVNFLSLLGWNPGDDTEYMERDVLIQKFTLEKINPKSAAFDERKLEWLNGQYFLRRDPAYFLPIVKPLWEKAGVDLSKWSDAHLLTAIGLLKDRSKRMGEFAQFGLYFFKDPEVFDEKAAKKQFGPGSDALLDKLIAAVEGSAFDAASLESVYKASAESLAAEKPGLKYGDLIHPTRLAISGLPFGPGLFELMAALGKETVLRRMRAASTAIKSGSLKTAALA
jgi:glutamyl-tRNA synthetase